MTFVETATPRIDSMSPRVTGCWYAMMAKVSMTAREYRGGFSGDSRFKIRLHGGYALKAPAARDLRELDLAALPVALELVEDLADDVRGQRRLEELGELLHRHRFARDEQRRFEDALDLGDIAQLALGMQLIVGQRRIVRRHRKQARSRARP